MNSLHSLGRTIPTLLSILFLALASLFVKPRAASAAMSCSESVADMQFGSINVVPGTTSTTTTTASISCSGAAAYSTYRFCVNMRAGPDASGNQRRMYAGSNFLPFNLYSDSGYSTPFGNWPASYLGGGLQVDFSSNGSGSISGNVTIYGKVPTSANTSPPAAYSEYMATVSDGELQYGSTPSNGSCPVGSSTALEAFTVYATVAANCTISLSSMNFGSASAPILSNVTNTATIGATCTSTTPYSIGLDNGQNASGTQRRMKSTSGAAYINYGLYVDSGYTEPWSTASSSTGCTNGVNTCVLNTGTGSNQNITVYGEVPPQTSPTVGSYSDSVVVTLTY